MVEKEGVDCRARTNYRKARRQTGWRVGADNGNCGVLVGGEAAGCEGGVMRSCESGIKMTGHRVIAILKSLKYSENFF